MNVLVCLKMVSQSTYTGAIGNNKNAGRLSDGQLVINPADAYALELALRMKDKDKTIKITAITMAPQYAEHILRTALSMGADQAVHVSDRLFAGADTIATAKTLARAVALLPGQELILCGNKAIDSETGHIGPQLAALLALPAITDVIDMDRDGDTMLLQRSQEDGIAVYRGRLPLLLTVQSVSPSSYAAQQAVRPYIHCNEHRTNDSFNHLLPNLSFGSESNRKLDCFRYAMIVINSRGEIRNGR